LLVFFSNIKTVLNLTVGLVLIFPPAAMIKECAAKYSITLRTEEEEIKYRNTLYLTCPKHLGRMHVHTGDAAPELSPGTAVLLL